MKKSIFGAVILSAALAVGTCMPAFAATPPSAPTITNPSSADIKDVVGGTQSASTSVNVATYITQINVAVPLTLPIYADQAGGKAVVPSNGSYYIENLSSAGLKVTQIDYNIVPAMVGKWNLGNMTTLNNPGVAASDYSATDESNTNGKTPSVTARTKPEYGSLAMTLTPQSGGSATNIEASGTETLGGTAGSTSTPLDWAINPAINTTIGNGTQFKINVAANSSVIAKSIAIGSGQDVIAITYTIGLA